MPALHPLRRAARLLLAAACLPLAARAEAARFDGIVLPFKEVVVSSPVQSTIVAVSMPAFNRVARSRFAEAKKRQVQAALNVKRAEVTILSAVDTAMRDIEAARQRVELVKDSLKLAESALDAEVKRLESGLTTSYNVLTLQKELSQVRSRELATIVDLNKAITTLLLIEGTLADRMNILVKI